MGGRERQSVDAPDVPAAGSRRTTSKFATSSRCTFTVLPAGVAVLLDAEHRVSRHGARTKRPSSPEVAVAAPNAELALTRASAA